MAARTTGDAENSRLSFVYSSPSRFELHPSGQVNCFANAWHAGVVESGRPGRLGRRRAACRAAPLAGVRGSWYTWERSFRAGRLIQIDPHSL